jgi:hypothetical protein
MSIVGKIWLSNLAQFQDQPEMVEYQQDGEQKPDIILPSDYQGKIELTIDDDSLLPLTKDERRDIALQFLVQVGQTQKLAIEQARFFQDPTSVPKIKYGEFIEELAQYFSVKDVSRYLEKAVAPMESVVPEQEEGLPQLGGGQSPEEAAIQGMQGATQGFESSVGGM